MGIKNGLAGIDAGQDWQRARSPTGCWSSPPTAGEAITDAVREALKVTNLGRALAGEAPLLPKGGARFHFEAPGSLQGFCAEAGAGGALRLENVSGHSSLGNRSLALHYDLPADAGAVRASTPTFILPEERGMPGYELLASPTLYAGQEIYASLQASADNLHPVACRLFTAQYGTGDELLSSHGPWAVLEPGETSRLVWELDPPVGATTYQVGLEVSSDRPGRGTLYLDCLGWSGPPQATLVLPAWDGVMWRRAWVDGRRPLRHSPLGDLAPRPGPRPGIGHDRHAASGTTTA